MSAKKHEEIDLGDEDSQSGDDEPTMKDLYKGKVVRIEHSVCGVIIYSIIM